MRGCRSAEKRARRLRPGATAGVRSAQPARTSATPATATNAGRGPMPSAKAPTAGPSSAPKIAAPIAVPSISPRRSRGVPATSHASAPAQERALPKPCASLAIPSSAEEPAKPKAALATAMSSSPATPRGGVRSGRRRSRRGSRR